MVTQLTPQQRVLAQKCIDLEKEIWELYQNKPHFPCDNDDWSDVHQEYLEWQYELRDIDEQYQKAQKEFFKSICNNNRKVKTAKQYYVKQKDFEDTVAYYKKNHINGF